MLYFQCCPATQHQQMLPETPGFRSETIVCCELQCFFLLCIPSCQFVCKHDGLIKGGKGFQYFCHHHSSTVLYYADKHIHLLNIWFCFHLINDNILYMRTPATCFKILLYYQQILDLYTNYTYIYMYVHTYRIVWKFPGWKRVLSKNNYSLLTYKATRHTGGTHIYIQANS